MIHVRMIYGAYDAHAGPGDYFLEPVSFPSLQDADAEYQQQHASPTRTINSEDELREWAERRFAYYQIWWIEVPDRAVKERAHA